MAVLMLDKDAKRVIKFVTQYFGITEYFLGGSRRFGYNNSEADVDLMCLCTDLNTIPRLIPYRVAGRGEYSREGSAHYRVLAISQVDIILMRRREIYNLLSAEHKLVEKLIKKHPILKTAVKIGAMGGFDNKTRYQYLLRLAAITFTGGKIPLIGDEEIDDG